MLWSYKEGTAGTPDSEDQLRPNKTDWMSLPNRSWSVVFAIQSCLFGRIGPIGPIRPIYR